MTNGFHLPLHKLRTDQVCSWCRLIGLLLLITVALPAYPAAGTTIPGEGQRGFFYTVTHLHPAAYIILSLVVVLSIANLVFQYGFTGIMRPVLSLLSFFRGNSEFSQSLPVLKGLQRARIGTSVTNMERHSSGSRGTLMPRSEAVISVRKLENSDQIPSATVTPTPLEGIDHSLHKFMEPSSLESGTPRVRTPHGDQATSASEFKFSSAVDVPTPEEVKRREKTHLVVTGRVLGIDGKGLASAMVYLTDEQGNRVGQSCRTMPDTGEFKVAVSEPGKYRINGYKRGFVMELDEAPQIPIESGKIEDFNFRMVPEGCSISGRILQEGHGGELPEYEVSCICKADNHSRSARTTTNGQFRIRGVPANSECFLEVRGADGSLQMTTDTFQTVQKKDLYREIKLTGPAVESPDELQMSLNSEAGKAEEMGGESVSVQQTDSDASPDPVNNSESLSPRGPSASP